MYLFTKNKYNIAEIKKIIVIYYIVGLFGFLFSPTRELFIKLIPISLILSIFLMLTYHNKFNVHSLISFLLIYLLGYLIEIVGVKTHIIFGHYFYGKSLGPKIFDVPLIIGINWLMVTYSSLSFLANLKLKRKMILFLSPLLMVFYDFFIEKVAANLDMWHWETIKVPIKNYVDWYIIGFVFVMIIQVFKVDVRNQIAPTILYSQFAFFFLLSIMM